MKTDNGGKWGQVANRDSKPIRDSRPGPFSLEYSQHALERLVRCDELLGSNECNGLFLIVKGYPIAVEYVHAQ